MRYIFTIGDWGLVSLRSKSFPAKLSNEASLKMDGILICMVAGNCHSSKRHKIVTSRLNLNHFELKMKWK